MNTVDVMGIQVLCPESREQMADHVVSEWLDSGRGGGLVALNAEKLIGAAEAEDVQRVLSGSRWVYPDGVGAVLAVRRKGAESAVKVAGAELWRFIVERVVQRGLPVAIIGGKPEVLEQAVSKLKAEFPSVQIALALDGYKGMGTPEELRAKVAGAGKAFFMLALGSPRQERLIQELLAVNPGGLYMGVGGSMDVYTGAAKRAPEWALRFSMEWLYRLLQQPSRWRRYLRLLKLPGVLLTRV